MALSPGPPANGSRLLRTAGFLLALAFRPVPKQLRFRAAIVVARWLEPVIAPTNSYKERSRMHTDDLRETSLELVLMMLTRHGTPFDPIMRVDGAEHVREALSGPTVVLAIHTMLSTLLIRYIKDLGHELVVIGTDPHLRAPGTRSTAYVVTPSPTLLLQLRQFLKDGRMIAGMIDRGDPERRNSVYQTTGGPMRLSNALLRLALRHNARVLFLGTKMDAASRVVMRISVPSPASHDVPDVLADFVRFVDEIQQVPLTIPSRTIPSAAPPPAVLPDKPTVQDSRF